MSSANTTQTALPLPPGKFSARWEELQSSTPGFSEPVTELAVLLARLDAEEDRIARDV
jgi:hypothetical protein